jgi:hypothetical protein
MPGRKKWLKDILRWWYDTSQDKSGSVYTTAHGTSEQQKNMRFDKKDDVRTITSFSTAVPRWHFATPSFFQRNVSLASVVTFSVLLFACAPLLVEAGRHVLHVHISK